MMTRRGLLGLLVRGTVAVAAARIPVVSKLAATACAKFGWIQVKINGQRLYVPFWR